MSTCVIHFYIVVLECTAQYLVLLRDVVMSLLNMLTTGDLLLFIHGVISLPDATSCDKIV